MCGIAAILSYHPEAPRVEAEELRSIRDRMIDRGPDGAGEWYSLDQKVGLAHRRLAIIDLSPNGAQPMSNHAQSLVVTFNGEIYNYRELRSQLEQKGHRFKSRSDTEVLLHLYAEEGEEMVQALRGMYAFAIWDEQNKGLFLARDPFGIKPLYYADDGRTFRAASQVKALLAGHISPTPEPAGQVGFFLWGNVPEPYTFHREIRSLMAGSTLWIDQRGNKRSKTFCRIADIMAEAENGLRSGDSPSKCLSAALVETVDHHLVADVPVGVFLSSGLDSTTLAAMVSQKGARLQTVTLGFEEFRGTAHDETPLAEQVARQYATQHQTIWVTRSDFQTHFEKILAAMDQPSIDGINTYFVSLAAVSASLKVALSGLGGDELFGGYSSFQEIPRLVQALGSFHRFQSFGKGLRILTHPILKRMTSPKYAGLLEYGNNYSGAYLLRRGVFMPWELPEFLDPEIVREGWNELQPLARLDEAVKDLRSNHLKISSLETSWYMRNQLLRDSDWASMAHSLELRVPLVDIQFLRRVAPLMAQLKPPGKQEMAQAPSQPLPAAILKRSKTGFGIPVREWLMRGEAIPPAERGLRGWARVVYSRFRNEELPASLLVAARIAA